MRDRRPGLLTDDLQCLACQARGAGFQTMHALVKRIGTGFDPLHRLRAPGIELVAMVASLSSDCLSASRLSWLPGVMWILPCHGVSHAHGMRARKSTRLNSSH